MNLWIVLIMVIMSVILSIGIKQAPRIESFTDQTFKSPKSDIQNFNETTRLHQNLNQLQAQNSQLIDPYQPLPDWVYPHTYVNRYFDQILITLVHKMEKDFNHNLRLSQRPNQEWRHPYPYQTVMWHQLDPKIQSMVLEVIGELNRRFNVTIPIVGFRRRTIQYVQIDPQQLIVILKVYKRYTMEDLKYYERTHPDLNRGLTSDFERELLIYLDQIDADGFYHLKYLRFPQLDYEHDDIFDDMAYVKEFDQMFYLAQSRNPMYRMLSNTEARDLYISHLMKEADNKKYGCFSTKNTVTSIRDQNTCELSGNLWSKKCVTNTDCPYFQQNRNYPNNFGQCQTQTGYCQMPVGVEHASYTQPANPEDAYCYNCSRGFMGKHSLGQCCQEQKPRPGSPGRVSPDYMFQNDLSQRRQSRQELERLGLKWSQI